MSLVGGGGICSGKQKTLRSSCDWAPSLGGAGHMDYAGMGQCPAGNSQGHSDRTAWLILASVVDAMQGPAQAGHGQCCVSQCLTVDCVKHSGVRLLSSQLMVP